MGYLGWTEQSVDLKRRVEAVRREYYDKDEVFKSIGIAEDRVKHRQDYKFFEHLRPPRNVNAPFEYRPVSRFPFRMHGVTFELLTTGDHLGAVFDREELHRAVEKRTDSEARFTHAELLRSEGRSQEAVAALEQCRSGLALEEVSLRRQVEKRLYAQYRRKAWRAAARRNWANALEGCRKMAQVATSATQEVRALFALAEVFEKLGRVENAAGCLQRILRYYGGTPYAASTAEIAKSGKYLPILEKHADAVALQQPAHMESVFGAVHLMVKKAFPLYFSGLALLPVGTQIPADRLAVRRLFDLMERHPDFRERFSEQARVSLEKLSNPADLEAGIEVFPGTPAVEEAFSRLQALAEKEEGLQRLRTILRLGEKAEMLRLRVPEGWVKLVHPGGVEPSEEALPGEFHTSVGALAESEAILYRFIPNRGRQKGVESLAFVSGRRKRRLDNKFYFTCWNLQEGRSLWTLKEQRLTNPEGPGWEECFVHERGIIVRSDLDVVSLDLKDGRVEWRRELPLSLQIRFAVLAGPLLVLLGKDRTLALHTGTGEVMWEEKEEGEPYGRPMIREGCLVSVRNNPGGVVFRHAGTGHLRRRLGLEEELDTNREHPVLLEGAPALPIGWGQRLLVVTDGLYYTAIDTKLQEVVWEREIDANDQTKMPALRLFIREPYVVVLKEDFQEPSLHVLDSKSGELQFEMEVTDGTMTCFFGEGGKRLYRLSLPKASEVAVTGMDLTAKGKEVLRWVQGGYSNLTEVAVLSPLGGGRMAFRVGDERAFEVWVFDVVQDKCQKVLQVEGIGPFGAEGKVSTWWQGRFLGLMNKTHVQMARP